MSPRHYEGKILYLPLPSDPAARQAGREATSGEVLSLEDLASRAASAAAAAAASGGAEGAGGGPVGGGWRVLDGPLEGLWAMNLAWGSETVFPAPSAEAADGTADLVVVTRPNRGCAGGGSAAAAPPRSSPHCVCSAPA